MDVLAPKRRSRSDLTRRPESTIVQPRDIDGAFVPLNHHGPLSKAYLDAFVQLKHPQTTPGAWGHRLWDLSSKGSRRLDKPVVRIQRMAMDKTGRPFDPSKFDVYALSSELDSYLLTHKHIAHPSIHLTKWNIAHALFQAHVTATAELVANKHGIDFTRKEEIIGEHSDVVPTEINLKVHLQDGVHIGGRPELRSSHKGLQPDYYFSYEDERGKITFLVEVDCGNEPYKRADLEKKSWQATLLKYIDAIEHKRFQIHIGIEGTIRVLLFFNDITIMHGVQKLLLELTGDKGKNYFCFRLWPEFFDEFYVPSKIAFEKFEEPFERVGTDPKTKQAYQPFYLV